MEDRFQKPILQDTRKNAELITGSALRDRKPYQDQDGVAAEETEEGLCEDENEEACKESQKNIRQLSSSIAEQIMKALNPTIEAFRNEVRELSGKLNKSEEERHKMVTELVEKTNDMVTATDIPKITNQDDRKSQE